MGGLEGLRSFQVPINIYCPAGEKVSQTFVKKVVIYWGSDDEDFFT